MLPDALRRLDITCLRCLRGVLYSDRVHTKWQMTAYLAKHPAGRARSKTTAPGSGCEVIYRPCAFISGVCDSQSLRESPQNVRR